MKPAIYIRWVLLGIAFLGAAGLATTGQVAYARLLYTSLALFLVSFLWSKLSLRGINLNRIARLQRASVGEVFEEHFEITARSWPGCVWLEVTNQSNLPRASGSKLITGISAREKRFYSSRTLLTCRGTFSLGPTSLSSGDPFGIFPTQRSIPAVENLIVLPMTVNISTFPPPPGLLPGGKAIRQKTMDVTPHAAGIREYVPGDPMKRIHWPSTARRNRFMVKEFEQDPQSDIWIFLDAQREFHYKKELSTTATLDEEGFLLRRPKVNLPCDSFEYAISAAASLARFFLGEKRAVGLACATNHFVVVPAERGERQVGKILETLAFLQSDGDMPLLGLVTMQAKLLPLGSGVILITSSARAELLTAVEDLQHRNLSPLIIMIKPDTFGGPVSADALATGLIKHNVPVCQVGYGDDLGSKLSLPAVYFQRNRYSRSSFTGWNG